MAYEVLGDPEKRQMYDKYGEEGVRDNGGMGGGGMDIFDLINGRMGGGEGQRGPKKGKSVLHPVKATLEDLYNGKSTKIVVNRERICNKCDGKGGKGPVNKCSGCNGRGMVTKMQMLGPGMYTQRTAPCDDCNGAGETINEKDKCKNCNGHKTVKEKKVIEV